MKEILQQYSSYNYWANERLLNLVLALDENLQKQIVPGSFPTLYATFLHIWDIESIWWQRIKLQERIIVPSESSKPDMKEVAEGLLNQSKQWEIWVHNTTEASLEHVVAYYNSKKEYFKNPVWKSLMHLFNHGTYHRGQVVTTLHNLNIIKIPNTDFIAWSRKR
jgi:uncharacterized damage-inducible protein DinB